MSTVITRILHIITFLSMVTFNLLLPFVIENTCKQQLRECYTSWDNNTNCEHITVEPNIIQFCVNTTDTNTGTTTLRCTNKCQAHSIIYIILYSLFIVCFIFSRKKYIVNTFNTNVLNLLLLVCYTVTVFNNLTISKTCSKQIDEYFYLQEFYKYCKMDSYVITTSIATLVMLAIFFLLETIEQKAITTIEDRVESTTPLLHKPAESAPPLSPLTINSWELSPPSTPSPDSQIIYPDLHKTIIY